MIRIITFMLIISHEEIPLVECSNNLQNFIIISSFDFLNFEILMKCLKDQNFYGNFFYSQYYQLDSIKSTDCILTKNSNDDHWMSSLELAK